VSQSGALGEAILSEAAASGLGVAMFVSMGNKTDVSGNDLLEYWGDNPDVQVILMYLESFGNPRKFTQIARRLTRKKPVITVKSGRTAAGARLRPRIPAPSWVSTSPPKAYLSNAACCGCPRSRTCLSSERAREPARAPGRSHCHRHERRRAWDLVHRRPDRRWALPGRAQPRDP